MKDVDKEPQLPEADFELDFEKVAELRRRAEAQSRAQANVVDGDTIQSDEEE